MYIYIYEYICIYVYMYICMYVYIHTGQFIATSAEIIPNWGFVGEPSLNEQNLISF